MNKNNVGGVLVVTVMLFMLLPVFAFAAGAGSPWDFLILDNGGAGTGGNDIGLFTDIAVDKNNSLHISYIDETTHALKYATNATGAWQSETVDNTVNVAFETSIAIDKNGVVHISYYDNTNYDLRHAYKASVSWTAETVDGSTDDTGRYSSIAIDSGNNIYISYYDASTGDLLYAKKGVSVWETGLIIDDSDDDVGKYSSIAIDSGNNIYISYYDASNGDLLYAKKGVSVWEYGAIDNSTSDDVGRYSSIVIDGNDIVHVSYYNVTTGDLKYAETYSDGWLRETVDSLNNVGQFTSIAIDSLHNIWISYYDATNQTLRYANGKYGSWGTGQIEDINSNVGQYSAIVLDHTNRIHASYYDAKNGGELKYASDGFPLTVTKTGSGVVMSDPPGINCGTPADCNEIYGDNTIVTLKAIPDAGSYFTGWSGCASSTMICKAKMNAALNVNATFNTGLPPVTTWVETLGDAGSDEAYSIQQTFDGGFAVAGVKDIGTGAGDAWIMKLYGNGTIDWQKTFANSLTDEARNIQQTSDGGFIISGEARFNVSSTGDFWILKLDAGGNITWEKTYGDEDLSGIQEIANSVKETFDGGYIVAGKTSGDIWILKLDQDGNVIWQKSYGSEGLDMVSEIQQTTDGGYIAAGETADSVLVLKLDAFGNIVWGKSYSDIYYSYSSASSIRQTTDGGYIVAGLNSFSGDYDIWVLKLDSNGNLGPGFAGTWQKSYGTSGADEAAASIRQTPNGGYVVAGSISDNIWVLNLDQDGNVIWQHSYSSTSTSTDYASSIEQTQDGFIIAGTTYDGSLPKDFFLLKIDKNGDVNGCPIISTPTYSVTEPSSIYVSNSSLYWASTSFTPVASDATVTDTDVLPFTICSGPSCIYSITPESNTVSAAGGNFSFSITTSTGCEWNASKEDSWITITTGSGSGSGTVNYTISSNTGLVRQGMIDVAEKIFTITQNGPLTYYLSVIKSGTGTGTVVSSEAPAPLINCGTNCDDAIASYPKDSQVKLKATADAGSVFESWAGACSGKGDCDLVMNANKTVSAKFAINTLTISTQAGQGGSINPTGKTVNFGETALFTVTPDAGYHTVNVSGCGVIYEGGVIAAKKKKKNVKGSAAGEVYITGPIKADCTVSASFAISTFTVTPIAGEHGNIDPSIQQTVNYNDMVPFSVKADDGYHIQSVSGCNGTAYTAAKKKKKKKLSAVLEMTYTTGHITESCPVTASFAINTFTVTPKAGEHGSIDPSAPLTVNYLDTVSFTVKPDAGYHIASVTGTGCGVHPSEGGTYITDPVTGDCTVEATFAKETFTATILKSGTGSGAVTGNEITCGNACEGAYEAGSKLTLKIKPDDGYRVTDVEINGKSIGPVQTITLKEILSNFTIKIVFGPISP